MRPAHVLRQLPLGLLVAIATVLAALAASGAYLVLDGGDDPGAGSTVLTLAPAGPRPDGPEGVTLLDYDRGEVNLADALDGKATVVNFFASTCVPCVTEMPAFEEVHADLGDRVTFLGLAVNDRPDDAADIVRTTGVTYRTLLDPEGAAFTFLGAIQLPTTVLIGADGEVRSLHNGALSSGDLRSAIADAFAIS